jgi:acetyl esterase/lipase
MVWIPKLWAGAWSPFLALAGILGAWIGWARKDHAAMWAGLFGAIAGLRHTIKVTRPKDHFAQAFGADWEDRIHPKIRARASLSRYRLIQPKLAPVPGKQNVWLGASGKTNEPLLCDIWEPPDNITPSGLAVIYLHGGLWQAVDKDFLTQPFFRRLAHQGHMIMYGCSLFAGARR